MLLEKAELWLRGVHANHPISPRVMTWIASQELSAWRQLDFTPHAPQEQVDVLTRVNSYMHTSRRGQAIELYEVENYRKTGEVTVGATPNHEAYTLPKLVNEATIDIYTTTPPTDNPNSYVESAHIAYKSITVTLVRHGKRLIERNTATAYLAVRNLRRDITHTINEAVRAEEHLVE